MDKSLEQFDTKKGFRYNSLDSLRGVCACVVVMFHFVTTGTLSNLAVVRGGALFVDFFFVLSGFVIAASYGARLASNFPIGKFMFLRFFRVYPLHVAMLALFVTMELVGMVHPGLSVRQPFTGNRSLSGLLDNFFLLQTFDPVNGLSWNNPAWSISAEFWTYLVAAVVIRGSAKYLNACTLVMVSASALWLFHASRFVDHDADWGIVRCIYGFSLGMIAFSLLEWLRHNLSTMGTLVMTAAELLICGLALWLVAISAAHPPLWLLAPPAFVAVIVTLAVERGALSKLLLTRPMRLLGLLSYSIYMTHEFLQGRLLDVIKLAGSRLGFSWVLTRSNGFKDLVAPPLVSDVLTVIMLLLVIAVAWLTYHFIEKPARKWSRVSAIRIWASRQASWSSEAMSESGRV